MVRSQNGGMAQRKFGPEERRGKSAERSGERETIAIRMIGSKDAMVRSQNRRMAQK